MKVLGIGLSKTGTTSLAEALRSLGYSVVDFPKTMREIERHEAATDTPVAAAYETLDRRFPGSKFVYTVRDKDKWLESCRAMWARRQPLFNSVPFIKTLVRQLYGTTVFDADAFSTAYDRHDAKVRRYFAERPSDLLVVDLSTRTDRWEVLCGFLGKPVPTVDFPRSNTSRDIDELILRLLKLDFDAREVARMSKVPTDYVADLRAGPAFEGFAFTKGYRLSDGWETDLILRGLGAHFRAPAEIADRLRLDRESVERTVERLRAKA